MIEVEDNWLEDVEYKYVVGQDPGGTSGIAVLRYTDNTAPELVYLHQIPNGREGFYYFFIGTVVGEGTPFTSVSEKWETREGVHGANLEPVYIEGIQYAIWVNQTVYQSPSVKNMIGDEFLKAQNLWTEGKRHQMDALLHALYYLRSIGHKPTLDKITGDDPEPIAEPGEADEKTLPNGGGNDEGSETGEGGEGEGTPTPGTGPNFADVLEAMQKLADKSSGEPAEPVESSEGSGESGEGDGEGEPTGSGKNGAIGYADDGKIGEAKKKRTLNGAFMGFEEDED